MSAWSFTKRSDAPVEWGKGDILHDPVTHDIVIISISKDADAYFLYDVASNKCSVYYDRLEDIKVSYANYEHYPSGRIRVKIFEK